MFKLKSTGLLRPVVAYCIIYVLFREYISCCSKKKKREYISFRSLIRLRFPLVVAQTCFQSYHFLSIMSRCLKLKPKYILFYFLNNVRTYMYFKNWTEISQNPF